MSRKEMFLFGLMLGLLIAIPLSWVAHLVAYFLMWGIAAALVVYVAAKLFGKRI